MTVDVNGLKVAHFAAFGPGRSGQYATVKDLILAERHFGIDAQFIDCNVCPKCLKNEGCENKKDGDITTQTMDWATNADVFIRHSAIPIELEGMGKPIIICLHGRPENSFLLEKYGQIPTYSFFREVANDERYKIVVTFWKEHLFYFKHLIPEKSIVYIPPMVDLEQYSPVGIKRNYSSRAGRPNIMISDIWREDTTPFNVLFAAVRFIEKYCKTGRIHLYGIPSDKKDPIYIIINQLSKSGLLGDVCTLMSNMPEQYRAADFLVTPHVIATRVVREALSCGLPIISGTGNPYTKFSGNPRDVDGFADAINQCWQAIQEPNLDYRIQARKLAEKEFSIKAAGESMVTVIRNVIKGEKDIIKLASVQDEQITFAFSAYGDKFINNVFVLLQSIDSIYNGKVNIIFYYYNIDEEYLDEIRKILPYVTMKETKHKNCENGNVEYKTAQKSLIWKEILDDHSDLTNIVLMDADMLVVKKIGKLFLKNFDVGFCYKEPDDENVNWPINGGLMLVKNSELVRNFFSDWSELTINTQRDNKLSKRNGYTLWGGGDQVSLGYILSTRNPNKYKKGLKINNLNFLGFPMKYVNESRGIIPSEKTHIIHYKGKSWQDVLRLGVFSTRRPKALCNIMYKLNSKVLKKWQNRRHKKLGKWSTDFEMKYWNSHNDKFYIDDIKRVYNVFDVDNVVLDNMGPDNIEYVVEVGGGAYGGALRFFPFATTKYSIDIAMNEFIKKGKIPLDINCIKGDFSDLPISDSIAGVVFAWEVLDHALTNKHFDTGISELCRILKPGGLLFFNHPLHNISKSGHTVIKNKKEIIDSFINKGLYVISEKEISNDTKRIPENNKELCIVFGKHDSSKKVPSDVSILISKLDN